MIFISKHSFPTTVSISRRVLKVFGLCCILLGIILITLFGAIFGFMHHNHLLPIAKNEILSQKVSPDGERIAIIFKRNAGATTGDNFQLSIIKSDQTLKNTGGNTYISYSEFEVEWEENNSLIVYVNESSEAFKKRKKVFGVNILYQSI